MRLEWVQDLIGIRKRARKRVGKTNAHEPLQVPYR